MSDANWSDDRVSTLSKLWTDGLSASQIAKQLGGVSRNAVIGKVHRLGLSGRGAASAPQGANTRPARQPRIRRAAPARTPRPIAPTRTAPIAAPEGPGLIDNLAHLPVHACKWPTGDTARRTRRRESGPARRGGRIGTPSSSALWPALCDGPWAEDGPAEGWPSGLAWPSGSK